MMSVALAGLLAAVPGCTKAPTAPSHYAPFSQTDLRIGAGAGAANNNVLTVNYTGWFYDESKPDQKGVVFNSSVGVDPFVFTLGQGAVIAGWDQGLVGMRVGGLRRLVIPPSLAYGPTRRGLIPPNATLLFEIELLAME